MLNLIKLGYGGVVAGLSQSLLALAATKIRLVSNVVKRHSK